MSDWGVPGHRQESVDNEILDSGLSQARQNSKEANTELRKLKAKQFVNTITPNALAGAADKVTNKLQKYGNKKTISRKIVKKDNIKVNVKKILFNSAQTKDIPRNYKENFEVERRQLFFND